MQTRAREIAERVKETDFIRIVTHIDSDGVGAGAVAKRALDREGIKNEIVFVKNLDPKKVKEVIKDLPPNGLVWFCDLGSGMLPELEGTPCVVTDHHRPRYPTVSVPQEKRGDLLSFTREVESSTSTVMQLNPHDFGIDGSIQISGAGVTYLVAFEMNEKNLDMSVFAVVGAVGDIQTPGNKLVGHNREILMAAVENGWMSIETDITFYGRETRDIVQLLSDASEPPIPTLSRNPAGVADLLEHLGIATKDQNGSIRHWTDLCAEEKKKVLSAIIKIFLVNGPDPKLADAMMGEVYVIEGEEKGSPLRDAREFSTLLNACGRYGHYETALEICLGDRGEHMQYGLQLMWDHRANILKFIDVVTEVGIKKKDNCSYFYSGNRIPEEVVGIILGIMMTSGRVDRQRPSFAFADTKGSPECVKVSARASRTLVEEGLDLSKVMKKCASAVDGSGGGHDVAAGGTIPKARLDEFLDELDAELGSLGIFL